MPQGQQGARAARAAVTAADLQPKGLERTMPQQQWMTAMRRTALGLTIATVLLAGLPTAALSQPNCRNTGDFARWLAEFKREAQAQKISAAALAAAAPYLVLDQRIINIDRGQKFFAQTFLEMSDKMIPSGRLSGGVAKIKQHAALFAREDKDFGV
ncbi:MAG: hypothetical protein QOI40_5184, partial [Alphaproteobacteria bacterium]|nr:hypothetical protein [Alphaproteobacteria bacterium]